MDMVLLVFFFFFLSLLESKISFSRANDAFSFRRSLSSSTVRSGYFNQLTYTDSTCTSYLATAKVQILGQCYKSLNGFTSNTALLDFPAVGMATLNSSYYSDASCSKPAVSIYNPAIKSIANKIPTTCTLGTTGAGGYYQISTISSTMMTFPTTSCALVSKSYQYANCSGITIQSNYQVLNLCLQGITLYTCSGSSVTASVCGHTATASTSSCQAIASSPSGSRHYLPTTYPSKHLFTTIIYSPATDSFLLLNTFHHIPPNTHTIPSSLSS